MSSRIGRLQCSGLEYSPTRMGIPSALRSKTPGNPRESFFVTTRLSSSLGPGETVSDALRKSLARLGLGALQFISRRIKMVDSPHQISLIIDKVWIARDVVTATDLKVPSSLPCVINYTLLWTSLEGSRHLLLSQLRSKSSPVLCP